VLCCVVSWVFPIEKGTRRADGLECGKVPTTLWPKDRRMKGIGLYQQQNMLDASTSYGQANFTRVLGWSAEEYAVLSAQVRNELRDPKAHLFSW
jgi:hypothetical protein